MDFLANHNTPVGTSRMMAVFVTLRRYGFSSKSQHDGHICNLVDTVFVTLRRYGFSSKSQLVLESAIFVSGVCDLTKVWIF